MRPSIGLAVALAACSSPPAPVRNTDSLGAGSAAPVTWPVPAGWKSETIPFPLEFAPGISHRGVEELRFAPGMFDPASRGYWSYAFVWRTDDPATLAAPILAAELTIYFRGLIAAVDQTKHQVKNVDDIWVKVTGEGEGEQRFALAARLFDAFGDGREVVLDGWAERKPCGDGAVWVFVMWSAKSQVRGELDALGGAARCGQRAPAKSAP